MPHSWAAGLVLRSPIIDRSPRGSNGVRFHAFGYAILIFGAITALAHDMHEVCDRLGNHAAAAETLNPPASTLATVRMR